ncbi:hypothetical protein B0H14DRAFT_2644656 [Mycena olivaceomarginata]|nr:hypothetical protein B0H14DRAFT_2644656 [Mycena olivaceomarginata]
MIQRQPENFPKGLNLSKINIPDMQKLLLDPQIGFTTNLPGEQPTSINPEPPNPSKDANVSRGLENTMPNIQSDVRNVQLRIRDRRFEFNVIQRVNLHFVDNVDCRDNEWRASSMQYSRNFRPQSDNLTVFLLLLCSIASGGPCADKRPRTSSPVPLSVSESSGPSSGALVAKPQAAVDAGVAWLREKIEKRPGYTKFHSNRGKVLQNPDRVESWKFAAQVTSTFHKPRAPPKYRLQLLTFRIQKISKTTIEKALGISTHVLE